MKRILKSNLDKFFTKEDVAIKCISKLNLEDYDLIIDPSCGNGSFYKNINHNKIGIDIDPEINGVIKSDFLNWNFNYNIDRNKILVITNPPFGRQGSLAMKFFKKSTEFSNTIAFILPLSFSKQSIKNRIPINYHLIYEEILDENSYTLNNKDFNVKCVFQIWKYMDIKRNIIENDKEIGFTYIKNSMDADISIRRVGVYAGYTSINIDKSNQSHYFIKFDDLNNFEINIIIEKLNDFKWNDLTVGPRSISKGELTPILNLLLTNLHKESPLSCFSSSKN